MTQRELGPGEVKRKPAVGFHDNNYGENTMMIKTTSYALGELAYKIGIVADEPDLQESYGIDAETATAYADFLLASSERKETQVSFERATAAELKMLIGEAQDAAVVLRDIAKTAPDAEAAKANRSAREMLALAREIAKQNPTA